jgi:hypothetical protein
MADVTIGTISNQRQSAVAGTSFVEWGPVWAGGTIAAALSFVLLTFGSAIGLSFISPWANTGASLSMIGSLAVFWAMATQIGAGMAGGYVAGRMRSRWGETTEHEVEFRDGLHGGLVWAISVILGAALFVSAAGVIARTGIEAAGRTVASSADPVAYQVDMLLRPAGSPAGTTQSPQANLDLRTETLRIFTVSLANDRLTDADRAYLGTVVAQRTGVTVPDAEKRVSDAFAMTNTSIRETTDKARRGTVLTGLVTAASLLVALGASWWAAQRGGNHRDNAIPARFYTVQTHRRAA